MFKLIFISLYLLTLVCGDDKVMIGGLFDLNINETTQMFQYAIDTINNQESEMENVIKLDKKFEELPYGNEFATSKKLCNKLFRASVVAVIGPMAPSSAVHAMNICDAKEIPYIDLRPDADTKPPVVNMHPHPDAVALVFLDLIKAWNWEGFTILYESAPWLPRVAELLKLYHPKDFTVTVRRINLGLENNNFRSVLRRVKLSEDTHIVIDCSIELLPEVLRQAQQVGLMTDYHEFIITTMDMTTIDLEPYQYSGTNITGIRLVDPKSPIMQVLTEHIASESKTNNEEDAGGYGEGAGDEDGEETSESDVLEGLTADKMLVQTALVYDGILLLNEAIKQLDDFELKPKKLFCNNNVPWENGHSITNFMRSSVVRGLTGEVKFDNQGIRTNFILDIVELTSAGIIKVGTWDASQDNRLNMTRVSDEAATIDDGSLKNKTFIVLTTLTPPYGMLIDSAMQLSGNDRFEGFGIDLIHELSLMLGFNYEFQLQEDGVYGSIINNVTGEWNGMIRQIRDGKADLGITDLTITSERESGVDFTMPFMNLGISILYKKPGKEPPSTFSFMSPFSTEVWMYLGAAYLGVSLCLFILGRISPSEWDNPYPCIEEPTELENQFSLRNSLWFTIGALLQQGSEIAPKAPSTRAIAAIWWFFTLIMVSSYTANLAAFLTVESVKVIISSAEDLKNCGQENFECPVTFGAKKGGSTINFFKEAQHTTYKNMYEYMLNHEELLTKDNAQGLEWALTRNYAFLMESSSIEYIVERECNVVQVGTALDDKGYGIAMRKNSAYRSALSEGVLRLQEQGTLTKLKTKWWKEKKGGGACSDTGDEGGAVPLGVANVEGVFLLLIIGCVAAILCNIIEMLIAVKARSDENEQKGGGDMANALNMNNMFGVFYVLLFGSIFASSYGIFEWAFIILKRSKKHKVPFKEELIAELKFVAKCSGNVKTVRHRKSSSMDSRQSIQSDQSNQSRGSEEAKEKRRYREKS